MPVRAVKMDRALADRPACHEDNRVACRFDILAWDNASHYDEVLGHNVRKAFTEQMIESIGI